MISKMIGEVVQLVIKIVVIVVAVLALINGGKWAYAQAYDLMARTPNQDQEIKNVSVTVPQGASTESIAKILEENGLIDSTLYFRIIARMNDFDGHFQYGDYTFNTGMSEEDMMEILLTEGAKRETKQFTIVEGLTLAETAKSLASQGMCSEAEFYAALEKTNWGYEFLKDIPATADRKIRYQGYLYPDTYNVYADATAVEIIATMFDKMDSIWTEDYYAQAKRLDKTIDEIMTIASIIEKEVVKPEEQAIVSGIIYNRLDINMNLQMCSTVMYILDKHRDRLLYEDLETPSPYNTYLNPGLPVGPIANPGGGAIRAALFPDDNDYLYFVLKDDGSSTHEFNSDYNAHLIDRAKYVNTFNY